LVRHEKRSTSAQPESDAKSVKTFFSM